MQDARKYSATMVFDGAIDVSTDYLVGLLNTAMRKMGMVSISQSLCGMDIVRVVTPEGVLTLREDLVRDEGLLTLTLETEGGDAEDHKALLAGLLRPVLGGLEATHVEWLDCETRIPSTAMLDALRPEGEEEERFAEDAGNVTLLLPRRVSSGRTRFNRSRRPAAGQHAKIKAVANGVKVRTKLRYVSDGTTCYVPVDDNPINAMLPPVERTRRITAANDNAASAFSVTDARISRLEGSVRANLLGRDDSDGAERKDIPVEARLSAWAVTLSAATVSLPVAAPILVYNVVKGEDMRAASLVMGLAGFFTALTGSGSMTGMMPF